MGASRICESKEELSMIWTGSVLLLLASVSLAQGIQCGSEDTQLTICFPGTRTAASCEYAITNDTTQAAALKPCPQGEFLFGESCSSLPGLLSIAYGPCQEVSGSLYLGPTPFGDPPSNSILGWLDELGLQTIAEVGALLVRGYAFQLGPLPSTFGLDIIPNLERIGKIIPVTTDNARLYPLTILGAAVPQFSEVSTLEAGMLIENTPNTNFSSLFDSLRNISGPIVIVGNAQLSSLDGMENIQVESALGNLQIFGNPRLTDISALLSVFNCTNQTRSTVPIGTIEVIPTTPNAQANPSCLLTTLGHICQFISNATCPEGTGFGAPGQPRSLSPLPTLPLNLPLP